METGSPIVVSFASFESEGRDFSLGGVGVDFGFDLASLSCPVGEEFSVSTFKLVGSPSCEGFASSLRLFFPPDPPPSNFAPANDPKSFSVGLESAASALRLT